MRFCLSFLCAYVLLGCSSVQKSTNHKTNSNNTVTQNMEEKIAGGIDFFAKGESPASWTLEMEFNKIIRFKSLDGSNIIASSVKPDESKEQQLVQFITNTDKGKMIISIYRENCSNDISQEQYNRKVIVEVNGKSYTGCGRFIHSNLLAGKWVLQQLKGEKLLAADFAKGLPEIEFDPAESKLAGHDGCNRISGNAEIWGKLIKFGPLASTKMACIGKKESNLPAALSGNMISYSISNGQLMLSLPDDSMAVFNKK